MAWVAGYNPVGYMPEAEPAVFDDWIAARMYLIASIDVFKEEDIEGGNYDTEDHWDDLIDNLNYSEPDSDWGAADEKWSFWIMEQEDEQ